MSLTSVLLDSPPANLSGRLPADSFVVSVRVFCNTRFFCQTRDTFLKLVAEVNDVQSFQPQD
ncbi:hypothetical protein CEE69_30580 [Rhodopirellula bahusiensis]|uniref:Uncharacterized protein n=1 Tax=Rhodopirellula bahusiensis TaxID=2014065 RepID=A0A2G1VXU1_9BACT|nr:hypothetical protein CEE69_30580 [Rhodopirellula bahusiensis]